MKTVCAVFLTLLLLLVCFPCSAKALCFSTDTLVLEPIDPVVVLPSETKVTVVVEVVPSSGVAALYSVDVPKGSSLLEALELLAAKNVGFT